MKRHAVSIPAVLNALALPAAILIGAAFVVGESAAAFTGQTTNPGNSWTSGTVALTDNHAAALFNASNIVPGYTESHCITVSSSSTVQTALQFYAEQTANTKQLAEHLELVVNTGSGGTDGATSCTGFILSEGLYAGTLAGLATDHGTVGTALAVAAPLAPAGTRQFMITASFPVTAPNAVEAGTAGMTFNWVNHS